MLLCGSAKRCAELLEFQEYYNSEKLKVLHLSSTRWLSMHECVERFLKPWDVLKSYFEVALIENRLKQPEFIISFFNDETKAYFYFFKFVLNYINEFNALCQSRGILIGN